MKRSTAESVALYLMGKMKTGPDGTYSHAYVSGEQMGCELLDALGYVREEDWGFTPLAEPRLPDILPRWDDTCVALLKLVDQFGLIDYTAAEGAPDDGRVAIRPACNLGPARVPRDLMEVLRKLDLVHEDGWTASAETILWRAWPYEWPELDLSSDPRVLEAIETAKASVPAHVRDEMSRAGKHEDCFVRYFATEWVFYRHWRLDCGWVPEGGPRTLDIFHDPLGSYVCQRVTGLSPRSSAP